MTSIIPPVLCECGCGQPVAKGKRFVHGHRARLPQFRQTGPRPGWLEHFWAQAASTTGPGGIGRRRDWVAGRRGANREKSGELQDGAVEVV